jgi:hypothetical protein
MGRMARVTRWGSLGLQAAIATGVGWLCWKVVKLRRFYHESLADLMAEDGPSQDNHTAEDG